MNFRANPKPLLHSHLDINSRKSTNSKQLSISTLCWQKCRYYWHTRASYFFCQDYILLVEKIFKKVLTMKQPILKIPSLFLAILAGLAMTSNSRAALSLINADFQVSTGLTNLGGGWYGGVPAGWTGVNGNYSVMNWNSGDLAANLQVVGPGGSPFRPLYQSAGLLDSAAVVSLSFDILTFVAGYDVRAGIFNTNGSSDFSSWTALALPPAGYTNGGRYTLETAAPIAGGTLIGVAFWQGASGAGGIDNVSVIPEPSALSLLVMGSALTLVVASRRRQLS